METKRKVGRPRTLPESDEVLAKQIRQTSVRTVARRHGVTPQAVYQALKDRKIEGVIKPYKEREK